MSRPREVAVVGAGVVGFATAWFLLQRDVDVAIYERELAPLDPTR